MQKFWLLFLLGWLELISLGQNINSSGQDLSSYYRNSISTILLKINEFNKYKEFIEREFYNTSVPDKFFENKIPQRILAIDTMGAFIADDNESIEVRIKVRDQLVKDQFGKIILNEWFCRNSDGTFDLSGFTQRGLYSASDQDYIFSQYTVRGERYLFDLAANLIDRNYLLVIGFKNIETMEEYYQKQRTIYDNRELRGFICEVYGFLYKVDFSVDYQNEFFEDIWVDKDTPPDSVPIRAERYKNLTLNIIPDTLIKLEVSGTELKKIKKGQVPKQADELFHDLIMNVVNELIYQIEISDPVFQVKAPIYQTHPIGIKIGTKEGLGFEQRFFVYENIKVGENISAKQVGVIKAYSVANNDQISDGSSNPSLFYQTYGRKIDSFGMYAVQKNGGGNFFSAQGFLGGLRSFVIRGEISIANLKRTNQINTSAFLTAFRQYIEIGFNKSEQNQFYLTSSYGLIKDFFPFRNMFISPQIGFGLDFGFEFDKEMYLQAEGGIDLGICISPTLRAFTSFKAFYPYSRIIRQNTPIGLGFGIRKEF